MRLRVDFGYNGQRREVVWWQPIQDFPTAFIFDGTRWEWVMYQGDANRQYDNILIYSPMKAGDSRWYNCEDFETRFGYSSRTDCECGSIHTSAPQFHMFYCKMWRKV